MTHTAPPAHYNPMPMFGLRPPRCRECRLVLLPSDNPIVDLGGGVLAKFGLCQFCLNEEMRQREEYDQ